MDIIDVYLEKFNTVKPKIENSLDLWSKKSPVCNLPLPSDWSARLDAIHRFNQVVEQDRFHLYYGFHKRLGKSGLKKEMAEHSVGLLMMINSMVNLIIKDLQDCKTTPNQNEDIKRILIERSNLFLNVIDKSNNNLDHAYYRINHVPGFFRAQLNELANTCCMGLLDCRNEELNEVPKKLR